jgi:hypothetical protein
MIKVLLYWVFRLLIISYSAYKAHHEDGYFWMTILGIQIFYFLKDIPQLFHGV